MGLVESRELARYGVWVNTIAPGGRTRLNEQTPGLGERLAAPEQPGAFDRWDPANVLPLVACLATEDGTITAGPSSPAAAASSSSPADRPSTPWRRTAAGRWRSFARALEGLVATDCATD